ncbi:hypothetical protein Clacol_006302 [Clathrus columnatus]|uniref:PEP5/VPS11 N-terminal domain-containing protein n=1 Tax=Clathrus columnatus TaxID=1419009 RepID=A0AAV5ABP2_9AGAM|nr:hypothetical protein Clacol_006302 [Clathrus columnatus]
MAAQAVPASIPTEIAAITSTSPNLLVADIRGNIHALNRSFDVVRSWLAYTNGRATHMIARNGILITFGEEESSLMPLLKVWNLDSKDKKSGAPTLLRSVKVQHGNRPHPISCLALTNNLSHLAVGLADGTVLLYRHISSSLQSSTSLTSFPKPRVIHESPSDSVTGLGFREISDEGSPINLFIVTLSRTLVYVASPKGSASNATAVDEVGCDLGCTTMDWHKRR